MSEKVSRPRFKTGTFGLSSQSSANCAILGKFGEHNSLSKPFNWIIWSETA